MPTPTELAAAQVDAAEIPDLPPDADTPAADAPRAFPFVLKLKQPATVADETITEITFRRGRMADLKGLTIDLKLLSFDTIITVASRLTGKVTKIIEALDFEDSGEVVAIVMDFLEKSLPTGKKRSRS